MQYHRRDAAPPATPVHPPSTETYICLLHPPGSAGRVTLMALDRGASAHARIFDPEAAAAAAPYWLKHTTYVTVNRFAGPRQLSRLLALNALYCDLDYYKTDIPGGLPPADVRDVLHRHLADEGIPLPSIVLDSGRGLALIWLHDPMPRGALPRWQGAQDALVELLRPFGADSAVRDAARVFRLPGTVNGKTGRVVRTIGGDLKRRPFDDVADAIYHASGRPTRAELERRKAARRSESRHAGPRAGGLSPAARFRQVQADLEALLAAWGGRVPEGLRNVWLHLHATALSHHADPADIPTLVERAVASATPGLPTSEVRSVLRSTLKRLEGPLTACPATDARLHYAGATMAAMLGVDAEMATTFELKQIFPTSVRRERRAEAQTRRRREAGAIPREEWLAGHRQGATRPWEAEGVSERTWRRRRTGK